MMKLGDRKDMKPFLVKFGVAFVFSLAGIFVVRLRRKGTKPSLPPPSSVFSDHGNEFELGARAQHKDEVLNLKSVPSSCSVVSVASQRYEESYMEKVVIDNSMAGLSPSSIHNGDNNSYLLPEFNELVKEIDFGGTNIGYHPRKDIVTPKSDVENPQSCRGSEKDDCEQEVKNLKSMVQMLQDREKNLEVELLEYYGLKEQETIVMELQNRLKLNNMEGKLLNLKIESLQADNHRLEAQVADHAKTVSALEAAKTKIKLLKKKLRTEAEQNREQILAVQKRVTNLQEQTHKAAAIDPDRQSRLQRLKVLEAEAEDLRKSNMKLQLENSELARRLESTQMLEISVLEDEEAEALKEMSERLREENASLSKEVEKLHADKCAGVEELVYLKWINACLRYELRNYHPPAGKTVARDLSKTLSPKSEEKAKQLILEYAHTEGLGNSMNIDFDHWSTSQASCITDSENHHDDSSADKPYAAKINSSNKTKFFHKLRKLVRGKYVSPLKRSSSGDKMESFEDGNSPRYSSGTSTVMNAVSPRSSYRHSLDIQRLRSVDEDDIKNVKSGRSNSDLVSSNAYKRFTSSRESSIDFGKQPDQDANLLKFAEVLKSTHGAQKGKLRKNSSSFTFG